MTDRCHIILPDFPTSTVRRLLDILYTGRCNKKLSAQDLDKLSDCASALGITLDAAVTSLKGGADSANRRSRYVLPITQHLILTIECFDGLQLLGPSKRNIRRCPFFLLTANAASHFGCIHCARKLVEEVHFFVLHT